MLIVTSKTKSISALREDEDVLAEIQERSLKEQERQILKLPTLFFIRYPNPFMKVGKFVHRLEDGYEECLLTSLNGRAEIAGYRGPVFPHATLAPFLQAVQNHGMDAGTARQDRRRAMAQIGG